MARTSPVEKSKREPHEEKLSQMHDALYQLGDQARGPMRGLGGTEGGSALLPDSVIPPDNPISKAAKKHIHKLHKAFKSVKKD